MGISLDNKNYWMQFTKTVQADAGGFLGLNNGNEQANAALKNAEQEDHSFHYMHWYDRPSCYCPTYDFSVHNNNNNAQDRDDKNKVWLVVGGALCTIASAFAVGYCYKAYNHARHAVNLTSEMKHVITQALIQRDQREVLPNLYSLVNARNTIDQRAYEKVRSNLYSALIILAGSASLFVGATMTISTLVTIGSVAMVAGFAFLAFNIGQHWSDNVENLKECLAIVGYDKGDGTKVVGLADQVLEKLHALNAQMQPPPQYQLVNEQEGYVSIYPELPAYTPPAYNPLAQWNEYQSGYNPYSYAPSAPPKDV